MDSADPAVSTPTLATLAAMLERHEQMFVHLRAELANLTQAVAQLTPLSTAPPVAAPPPEAPAPALLQDRALTWAQAALQAEPDITFSDFLVKFKGVFDRKATTATAGQRLLALKQDALLALCIRVDDQVRAHRSARARSGHAPLDFCGTSTAARGPRDADTWDEEEPMQLGRSRLLPAERQRRLASGQASALQPVVPSLQGPAAPPALGWSAGLQHHPHHGLPTPGGGYCHGLRACPAGPTRLHLLFWLSLSLSLSLPLCLGGAHCGLPPLAHTPDNNHLSSPGALFEAGTQILSSLDDCTTDVSVLTAPVNLCFVICD
ncbi:20S proteasome subunit beta 11 [Sarotherodon galilaeus]